MDGDIMEFPTRKPNRIKGYDYNQNGAYFITICTNEKKNLFWKYAWAHIERPEDVPNNYSEYGKIVDNAINQIQNHYPDIEVDKYVIMPNHIHLILMLSSCEPKNSTSISNVINQLKGSVTRQIGFSCWQKSFYDHVIRNERDYLEIWRYIYENPIKWKEDCFSTDY